MSERQASTFRKQSTITFIQSKLGNHLNKAGIPFKFDIEVAREEGKFPYRLDILIDDPRSPFRLYIEAYGKDTKSDDFERDKFLRERGILPKYYPNALIENHPAFVIRDIRRTIMLLRSLWE